MMSETNTSGGASVTGNVDTGSFTGRDSRQQSDQRGGSVHFQSQDNAILWQAIIELGDKISSVREKLDDLPNRVAKLEVQFQPVPVPLPVIYLPPWLVILLIMLFVAVVGGVAYLWGSGGG